MSLATQPTTAHDFHLLELKALTRAFGGLVAVNNVSFSVLAREVVGLIGPNGSGKSTLANLLTGIYRPTSGRILFAGLDVTGHSTHALIRAGIARTFQVPRVFARLSVIEQVTLAVPGVPRTPTPMNLLRHIGTDWQVDRPRAEQTLAALGLWEQRHQLACLLPHGQRRILEIARCLATEPQLLVLDEPTAGLSELESLRLAELLHDLAARAALALIVIDHHLPFLQRICPRLLVLHEGRQLADGRTEDVLKDPSVVALYQGA